MQTIIVVFTFAIVLLSFFKVLVPSTSYPYFTLWFRFGELKVSPTMWYFFYPSLLYQIWFWFSKFGIV